MNLFRKVLVFTALFTVQQAIAQNQEEAVQATINQFFKAMESGDSTLLLSSCTAAPILQTFAADKQGKFSVRTQDFQDFVRFVSTPSDNTYKEEIEFGAIQIEASLASVWTPYRFYLNGQLSHCGTNSFQLVKQEDGWKIQYIIDTRRRNCE